MPPRLQGQLATNPLLPYISSSSTTTSSSLSNLPTQYSSQLISCSSRRTNRSFSSAPSSQTKHRNEMFAWLNTGGSRLKDHKPGRTNYLWPKTEAGLESMNRDLKSSHPFPLNKDYISQPILSEELRNEIHTRVVFKKQSIRSVSVDLGVDMRRVGAVVRLVTMEKRMKQQGKSLALPYARAVHEMVPTTPLYYDVSEHRQHPHESINDLPVHRLTDPQIFYPVSESRQFNRVDAGRVFSAAPALERREAAENATNPAEVISRITQNPSRIERVGKGENEQEVLQPADARIPHPHLIQYERLAQSRSTEPKKNREAYKQAIMQEETAEKERKRLAKERQEQQLTKVQPDSSRFEFRFKDVVVSKETTGPDGRGHKAPGRRYGVPSYERKKGQVKIPTQVQV